MDKRGGILLAIQQAFFTAYKIDSQNVAAVNSEEYSIVR